MQQDPGIRNPLRPARIAATVGVVFGFLQGIWWEPSGLGVVWFLLPIVGSLLFLYLYLSHSRNTYHVMVTFGIPAIPLYLAYRYSPLATTVPPREMTTAIMLLTWLVALNWMIQVRTRYFAFLQTTPEHKIKNATSAWRD